MKLWSCVDICWTEHHASLALVFLRRMCELYIDPCTKMSARCAYLKIIRVTMLRSEHTAYAQNFHPFSSSLQYKLSFVVAWRLMPLIFSRKNFVVSLLLLNTAFSSLQLRVEGTQIDVTVCLCTTCKISRAPMSVKKLHNSTETIKLPHTAISAQKSRYANVTHRSSLYNYPRRSKV